MKHLNKLNIFLMGIAVILVILFAYKIAAYKQWERYYYLSSISAPKEFPIHILGVWFMLENGDSAGNFYKDKEMINSFYSDWGKGEYYEAYAPQFLPQSLFLEYVDFRTQNYYMDTIALPKENMKAVFKAAKSNNYLKNLSSWRGKMGLEYHVGIANDGNIVFWLIGNKYEKEFYRTQLKPKPLTNIISLVDKPAVRNSEEYITDLFREIPDSVKLEIKQQDVRNVQYKDSIPVYFDNLQQ